MWPALWTTTSRPPFSARIFLIASSTDSCDATSISTQRRSQACSLANAVRFATSGALRPEVSRMPAYTLWPATARARAASAPKPLDAPVMTITLLTKLPPLLTCDVWGLPMLLAGQSLGLVRGHHGFVELLEECAVLFGTILFSKSQRLDTLDDGLCTLSCDSMMAIVSSM